MVQDKPLRTSWQRKMKERQERKLARDFARHLEEEKERRRQVRAEPVSLGGVGGGAGVRGCRGLAQVGKPFPGLSLSLSTRRLPHVSTEGAHASPS